MALHTDAEIAAMPAAIIRTPDMPSIDGLRVRVEGRPAPDDQEWLVFEGSTQPNGNHCYTCLRPDQFEVVA